jgi:hypothetical protein
MLAEDGEGLVDAGAAAGAVVDQAELFDLFGVAGERPDGVVEDLADLGGEAFGLGLEARRRPV